MSCELAQRLFSLERFDARRWPSQLRTAKRPRIPGEHPGHPRITARTSTSALATVRHSGKSGKICWDIRCADGLWKAEDGLRACFTVSSRNQAVMEWAAFYSRLHSLLRYLSAMQLEKSWLAAQRKSVS
jgi:hypothetical protein